MRIPGLVVPTFLSALFIVTAPVQASEDRAAAFTRSVLETLSAAPRDCRGPQDGAGKGVVGVCAGWSSDFESFRQAWDNAVQRAAGASLIAKPLTDWQTQVGGRIRWYGLSDKWIVVTLDADREIRVAYMRDKVDVVSLDPNVTPPRRIAAPQTNDERREARMGVKRDASTGVVVMSAVIRKDGTVGEVEVIGCMPRGHGLESAAITSLQKRRYEPAVKDGFPVNVSLVSAYTYGPGGEFRNANGLDIKDSSLGGMRVTQ